MTATTSPSGPPVATDSLVECALKVLNCPDPWQKAEYTYTTVKWWRDGTLKRVRPAEWRHLRAPDRPARSDDKVKVCTPGEAPRRGKGGTLASRQALLHSAVHIENWAVDLSWDAVARFGLRAEVYGLPRAFFDDFVTVAEDECRHFTALAKRLEEIGSHYGALPVHDGLWESASGSSHSLPARLAVEHCVHEARGLDVLPGTIAKFANHGDADSAALLRDVVYPEEVNHCAAGVRWIKYLYDVAHGRRAPDPLADTEGEQQPQQQEGTEASVGTLAAKLAELGVSSGANGSGSSVGANGSQGGEGEAKEGRSGPPAPGNGNSGSTDDGTGAGGGRGAGDKDELSWVSDARRYGSVEEWFHSLVRSHFWGALKPPFNEEARAKAGFGPEWYLPLAAPAPAAAAAAAAAAGAAAAAATATAAAAAAAAPTAAPAAAAPQVEAAAH